MKTIKDIAKIAKVSRGTVDKVIHGRGGVSKKTEIKVKKLLEELNFTPNLVARNLVLKKKIIIAILMPKANDDSPFWKFPYLGIKKALKEVINFGFNAAFYFYDQYEHRSYESALDNILNAKHDGLVLVPHFTKETVLRKEKIEKLRIPYVFLNVNIQGFNNVSFIGQDSYKSGKQVGNLFHLTLQDNSVFLIINFLEDLENHPPLNNRIKGLESYFKSTSSSITYDELKIKKFSKKNLRKLLTKKLVENNEIKGIFLPSNKISFVAEYLEEFDIKMDTVIGFDVTKSNLEFLDKNLITFLIEQKPIDQGYESVKVIFDHLVNQKELKDKYFSPIEILTKENAYEARYILDIKEDLIKI